MQASLKTLNGIVVTLMFKQYPNPIEHYANGQIKAIQEIQDEDFWDRSTALSTKCMRKWYIGALDFIWPS